MKGGAAKRGGSVTKQGKSFGRGCLDVRDFWHVSVEAADASQTGLVKRPLWQEQRKHEAPRD